MSATTVRIGVLLIGTVQLLDVSPIDLFGMLTKEYLQACRLPAPLVALAVPVDIVYISESGTGINGLTASAGLRVSADLNNKSCAPGNLDILMIPGPDPSTVPSDAVKQFMRGHAEKGANNLTICTGVFMAGYAELLDGKLATGPRALLPELQKKFPRVTWEDKRWTHDEKIWTSGMVLSSRGSTVLKQSRFVLTNTQLA
jgi:transcriptional regulator GlxA family with amidase domain